MLIVMVQPMSLKLKQHSLISFVLLVSLVAVISGFDRGHHHYQSSSSSWNYLYHYNWNDLDGPKSSYAESHDNRQYLVPPISRQGQLIVSRGYRHAEPFSKRIGHQQGNGFVNNNHNNNNNYNNHNNNNNNNNGQHGNFKPNQVDHVKFIDEIKKEIMSSFNEMPSGRSFEPTNGHNGGPLHSSGRPHYQPFMSPMTGPMIPPWHGLQANFQSNRNRRSHDNHNHHNNNYNNNNADFNGSDGSKGHSWNFNSNQGSFYRFNNVDGKKHEEKNGFNEAGGLRKDWDGNGPPVVKRIDQPLMDNNSPFFQRNLNQNWHPHPNPYYQHQHQHSTPWYQQVFQPNNQPRQEYSANNNANNHN